MSTTLLDYTNKEDSFTAELIVVLTTCAIAFFSLYAILMFNATVNLSFNRVHEDGLGNGQSGLEGDSNPGGLVESEKTVKKESEISVPPIPDRIVAPSIGMDMAVSNPRSRDLAILDSALLDGPVYYPGSGYLNEDANLLLFGHSSFLPVVKNENFRAFNHIKELKIGERIEIYSGDERFVYRVTSNILAKDSDVRVDFYSETPMITLTTCNSFGSKEDRYVVKAVLVE